MRYAKVGEVSASCVVVTDGGFTCMAAGEEKIVYDNNDGLFIVCNEGYHYIDGQLEEHEYVGLTMSDKST